MRVQDPRQQDTPLHLYIDYDFLPIDQAGLMLQSIGGLYNVLLRAKWDLNFLMRMTSTEWLLRGRGNVFMPLCIDTVSTGESITFKFAPKGKHWPALKLEGGDLDILLPQWTAAACVCGVLLSGGAWSYNEWLDIQLKEQQFKSANIDDQLKEETISKTRAETQEILARVDKIRASEPRDRDYSTKVDIEMPLQAFVQQAYMPNIRTVEVNGLPVKYTDHGSARRR